MLSKKGGWSRLKKNFQWNTIFKKESEITQFSIYTKMVKNLLLGHLYYMNVGHKVPFQYLYTTLTRKGDEESQFSTLTLTIFVHVRFVYKT